MTVKLLDDQGNELATTVTGVDGGYIFKGLEAGTYTVMVDDGTLPNSTNNPTYDEDNGTITFIEQSDL